MKNAPILILDDALSAVDTDTEEHILTNLKKNREGKTTILIAHRISTIQNADIIMVLEDGTAAEIGNHDSLMAKHGIYYDMFEKTAVRSIHGEAGKALIRQNYPAAKTGRRTHNYETFTGLFKTAQMGYDCCDSPRPLYHRGRTYRPIVIGDAIDDYINGYYAPYIETTADRRVLFLIMTLT